MLLLPFPLLYANVRFCLSPHVTIRACVPCEFSLKKTKKRHGRKDFRLGEKRII